MIIFYRHRDHQGNAPLNAELKYVNLKVSRDQIKKKIIKFLFNLIPYIIL